GCSPRWCWRTPSAGSRRLPRRTLDPVCAYRFELTEPGTGTPVKCRVFHGKSAGSRQKAYITVSAVQQVAKGDGRGRNQGRVEALDQPLNGDPLALHGEPERAGERSDHVGRRPAL